MRQKHIYPRDTRTKGKFWAFQILLYQTIQKTTLVNQGCKHHLHSYGDGKHLHTKNVTNQVRELGLKRNGEGVRASSFVLELAGAADEANETDETHHRRYIASQNRLTEVRDPRCHCSHQIYM